MNYSTYRFTLDLWKHQSQISIAVFQHDTAVKLSISFTDGGKPYRIGDGVTAVFYGKRADDKEIMHSCMIQDNTEVIYDFQESTSFKDGIVQCQIRLYDLEGKLITAPRFIIVVDERIVKEENLDIEPERLTALKDILGSEANRVAAEEKRVAAEAQRTGKFALYEPKIARIEESDANQNQQIQILTGNVSAINSKISLLEKEAISQEWDYVITTLEDLTTEKLAAMSGRVLVKELHYAGTDQFVDGRPYGQLAIEVPKSIELIKFVGSELFANITGTKDTTISGFVGATYPGDEMLGYFPRLTGFGAVEFCTNPIDVYNCDNVRHCHIRIADHCTNLTDIYSEVNYADGQHTSFYYCKVIDNVRIQGREDDFNRGTVEFQYCSNISNVFNLTEGVPIDYTNCTYVDGDTCDGYYTAEDAGKVPSVSLDGVKALLLSNTIAANKAWAGTLAKDTYTIPQDEHGVFFIASNECKVSFQRKNPFTGVLEDKEYTGSLIMIFRYAQAYEDQYNAVNEDAIDILLINNTSLIPSFTYNQLRNLNSDITITRVQGVPNIIRMPMNTKLLYE